MNPATASSASTRLFFLDWVRIIAFFVLILYHVGMVYVSWDYHVKSTVVIPGIEPLMQLSSPWRLGLLFLISGVASGSMLQKLAPGGFLRQRSWRLLLPLLFGMAFIVPPQSWVQVVEKVGYAGSFADFMQLYWHAYHGFCKDGHCLILPTWNHLWFVAYLWVYSTLLALLMVLAGPRFARCAQWLGGLLQGGKIILLPVLVLVVARLTLFAQFPETHDLVHDWYNHAKYLFLFLLGALMASQPRFWQQLDTLRWTTLGSAICCWAMLVVYYHLPDGVISPEQEIFWRDLQRVVYAVLQWLAMCAACGFAHRHLQFDSAKRRYLAQAVFPVYILHQTLIVVLEHGLKPCKFDAGMEALLLIVLTLTLSFAGFELVRRVRVLRPLFGLGPLPAMPQPLPMQEGGALAR